MKTKILAMLAILLVLAVGCAEQEKGYGSISGSVFPLSGDVMVQAIQNGSIVKQVGVKEDNTYNITGLPEGKYGLLFVVNSDVYIYKTAFTGKVEWFENRTVQLNKIEIVNVKENQDSFGYNIYYHNFSDPKCQRGAQLPDYSSGKIFVKFKPNISEDEINELIKSYNCIIVEVGYSGYYINIPTNKTVIEMLLILNSDKNVEGLDYEGILYGPGCIEP